MLITTFVQRQIQQCLYKRIVNNNTKIIYFYKNMNNPINIKLKLVIFNNIILKIYIYSK